MVSRFDGQEYSLNLLKTGSHAVSMTRLWCLHGNLQLPTVWESTLTQLWHDRDVQIIPVDLWSTTARDLWDWAELFCDRVSSTSSTFTPFTQNIILGYSLGGRLALHAVLHRPDLWQGAILLSTHPGLPHLQDRQSCLQADQYWGQRFLKEPWHPLLQEWDGLPVFNGIPCGVDRPEKCFSREQIARLFDIFSKGRQDDLLPHLKKLAAPPILYLSGALDKRYSEMGRRLAQDCDGVDWVAIAHAGHRVPWENSEGCTQAVQAFLRQVVLP
ncbi:MAG: alpha/beta fold hydrolase [Thermosynechococcaceae cyanobacterium]